MNNLLSYSSLKLDLFTKEGVRLKPASGFVLEVANEYYLITNWHVLSGKDVSGGEQPKPGMESYAMKISLHIHGAKGEKSDPLSKGMRRRVTIPLYNENDEPRWIEHPVNELDRPLADVVALPIQLMDMNIDRFLRTIGGMDVNSAVWSKMSALPHSAIEIDVEYGPPDPVYVVGYPLGWAPAGSDKTSTAFWRTSSIASEINEHGMIQENAFFIDPCALEGMTGSPVIGMKNDRSKLLGVYSDSSTAEFGADAGLVWQVRLVKKLIRAS